MQKIALAIARDPEALKTNPQDRSGETLPRFHLFEEAFSPVWDTSVLHGNGSVAIGTRWWRMARAIQLRHSEYDGVVTWGEKLSLAMLMRQQRGNPRKPHIAMMYQFEKPNIQLPLTVFRRNLDAVVTWSTVQRRALIDRIGFPAERVYLVRHYVDQVFFSPRSAEDDLFCAVGAEMRDYATFTAAVRGTGLRCHIATDHVRIPGRLRLLADRRRSIDDICAGDEPNLTAGRMSLVELRNLYARSRFVVVPLLASDADNGVTCILQAMAMGKPVICSRTRGQVDVIQEGVTGLYVPVGDAAALRRAITSLWNEPERAREMGRNARAFVEKYHTLEQFTTMTRAAAEAAVAGRQAPETWLE